VSLVTTRAAQIQLKNVMLDFHGHVRLIDFGLARYPGDGWRGMSGGHRYEPHVLCTDRICSLNRAACIGWLSR